MGKLLMRTGTLGTGLSNPFSSASPGLAGMRLQDGPPMPSSWPIFDAGLYVYSGKAAVSPPVAVDRNAGRPPRQIQWSIGIQREITKDFMVEAAYVGNRGAWWNLRSQDSVDSHNTQKAQYDSYCAFVYCVDSWSYSARRRWNAGSSRLSLDISIGFGASDWGS
jgi:hypothetical protein